MAIYTRTGDDGYTKRPGDLRIRKSDPRVEATGAIDELIAGLGWCGRAARGRRHAEIRRALGPLQSELFVVGALLAAAGTGLDPDVELPDQAVARMEGQIDAAWPSLPELTHFILPGGCELACRLHTCRTICRRAERSVAAAAEVETRIPAIIFKYMNRLSDLLFTMARLANHNEAVEERTWTG